jgi:hypothetical protein
LDDKTLEYMAIRVSAGKNINARKNDATEALKNFQSSFDRGHRVEIMCNGVYVANNMNRNHILELVKKEYGTFLINLDDEFARL